MTYNKSLTKLASIAIVIGAFSLPAAAQQMMQPGTGMGQQNQSPGTMMAPGQGNQGMRPGMMMGQGNQGMRPGMMMGQGNQGMGPGMMMGRGMMGGMGPGMMGGMGPGMMGMGPGMMGMGRGMMGGMGFSRETPFTPQEITRIIDGRLVMRGLSRLKAANAKKGEGNIVTADVVTAKGELVMRLKVDSTTGRATIVK